MSHVAEVNMRIMDLDALSVACEELGLVFKAEQKTHKWYGRWMNDYNAPEAAVSKGRDPKTFGRCEHAIEVKGKPDAYGIGVVPASDGVGYDLVYDNWQGGHGLEAVAGSGLCTLKQSYAAQVSMRQLARQGFSVSRQCNERGEMQVVAIKR